MPSKALVPILSCSCALTLLPSARAAMGDETELTDDFLSTGGHLLARARLWRQHAATGARLLPGRGAMAQRPMPQDQIYLKTAYGFGRMPPWEEHVFSDHGGWRSGLQEGEPVFAGGGCVD